MFVGIWWCFGGYRVVFEIIDDVEVSELKKVVGCILCGVIILVCFFSGFKEVLLKKFNEISEGG